MRKKTLGFSVVKYDIADHLGLDLKQYCLCDIIYHLCASRHSEFPGWAYASNEWYGQKLRVTPRTIGTWKSHLVRLGLLEKGGPSQMCIRTTINWEDAHYMVDEARVEKISNQGRKNFQPGWKKFPTRVEKISTNNNSNKEREKDRENAPTAFSLYEIRKKIQKDFSGVGVARMDTPATRKKILEEIMPWFDTPDFKTQFDAVAVNIRGLNRVEPCLVVADWVMKIGFHELINFNFKSIRGWIRKAAQNNTTNGGKHQKDRPDAYDYGSSTGSF